MWVLRRDLLQLVDYSLVSYSVSVPTYPIGGVQCLTVLFSSAEITADITHPLSQDSPLPVSFLQFTLQSGVPKRLAQFPLLPLECQPSQVQNQRNQTGTDAAGEIHKSVIRYLGNPNHTQNPYHRGGTSTNRSTTAPNAAASSHHQINSFFFS